jgi:hypothetical protein
MKIILGKDKVETVFDHGDVVYFISDSEQIPYHIISIIIGPILEITYVVRSMGVELDAYGFELTKEKKSVEERENNEETDGDD